MLSPEGPAASCAHGLDCPYPELASSCLVVPLLHRQGGPVTCHVLPSVAGKLVRHRQHKCKFSGSRGGENRPAVQQIPLTGSLNTAVPACGLATWPVWGLVFLFFLKSIHGMEVAACLGHVAWGTAGSSRIAKGLTG